MTVIEYLGDFLVRELDTGKVRPITNVEMADFSRRRFEEFLAETAKQTKCCGGCVTFSGGCSRFPGQRCVDFDLAWALLREGDRYGDRY